MSASLANWTMRGVALAAIAAGLTSFVLRVRSSVEGSANAAADLAPPLPGKSSPSPAALQPSARESGGSLRTPLVAAHDPELGTPRNAAAERSAERIDVQTEKEHYERFLAQCAAGGDERRALEECSAALLQAGGPSNEKVALLRALYDSGAPRWEELFVFAVRELPQDCGPDAESVPAFALRFLGDRAERDPRARHALGVCARDSAGRLSPQLRGRALVRRIETADDAELALLALEFASEEDTLVGEMTAAALRARAEGVEPGSEGTDDVFSPTEDAVPCPPTDS